MRILLLMTLGCLSACTWFGAKRTHAPDPAEIVVTGAPAGSIVFVDGSQAAEASTLNDRPQIVDVTAGSHVVEIHVGDTVVYREDTYVGVGEHHAVRVLSGLTR